MALVTGGAVRIGRAICEALAARGCGVVAHYDRSERDATELTAGLRKKGIEAFAVKARFGGERECGKLIDAAWRKAGHIDFLINNAAVFHKDNLLSATEKKMMTEMQVNFLVPMWLTKEFARRIGSPLAQNSWRKEYHSLCSQRTLGETKEKYFSQRTQGTQSLKNTLGKVVNLLDHRITGVPTDCVPYLLSKKMLAEFTKLAALEFAPSITVNGVAPGPVLTVDRRRNLAAQEKAGDIPLMRRPTPEDVAAAVIFLLESDSITGQTIFVDGGRNLLL